VLHDHARPLTASAGHLLGTWTTLDDGLFDAVVSVDLWRVLTTHDLNRMIAEALRLAPRLLLVESLEHVQPGASQLDHLGRVIGHLFPVRGAVVPEGAVLEICRPDTAPSVAVLLRPAGLSAG
jgi:hypothetical protein